MSEQQPTPRTCTSCSGAGGKAVDTSRDGKTVQHWQRCGNCSGTGVQSGGI
ncbi:hypothetical protein [Streptomyces hirsutus]|uniref:hypothetical protein n=1 Tax=Streptomyces hirsutus TaxID=35620 RepID=UPI003676F983